MQSPVHESDDFLTALEYELYSMDYEKLIEVAQGLKTIAENVKQVFDFRYMCIFIIKYEQKIDEDQEHTFKDKIIGLKVGQALPMVVYDNNEPSEDSMKVFDDLGMTKLVSFATDVHCHT